ncbi:MAG: hypothetical protein E7334_08450 [Clostridiales bacterium]|nr:hypothetical protein [Clostridiales bacterium]MBQ2816661.1 hypothetical protein [Clostridia bacterium]MBQ4638244.1 hypothetical protein [Clostridia bacterium]
MYLDYYYKPSYINTVKRAVISIFLGFLSHEDLLLSYEGGARKRHSRVFGMRTCLPTKGTRFEV